MPAPSSYTEDELKEFMHSGVLKRFADELSWTVESGNYDEAVNETLLAYGVADISEVTSVQKLRLLARREIWRAAAEETAGDYDIKNAAGAEAKREQLHSHARSMLTTAEKALATYEAGLVVQSARLVSAAVSTEVRW